MPLAHNRVLFLDEIVEFNRKTLEALRQHIEDKYITISRVRYTHTYPANLMLVAAIMYLSPGIVVKRSEPDIKVLTLCNI